MGQDHVDVTTVRVEAPRDFPFEPGDRVAQRVLGPDGEAWFAGTMVCEGSGGVRIESADGLTMWVAWPQVIMRSVSDAEWDDQLRRGTGDDGERDDGERDAAGT